MKLSYRKTGAGKPLLILHGLFGSSDNWQTLGKRFSERFTVYLIDLRNHGRSPHSDNFGYGYIADDLSELMADEGIESPILLGHSLGGKAAMHYSVTNPGKVEKLVVADIGTKEYPVTNQQVIDALKQIDPRALSSRKEAEEKLKIYLPDEGTRQFLLKNLYWNDEQKLNWRFNFDAISRNIHQVGAATPVPAHPIILPVLFVKGENSDYISTNDLEQIKSVFPNASLKVIAGAGHWIHADKPDLFMEAVMRFLSEKS